MKYRLTLIVLFSLLIASLSFNIIHSESLDIAKQNIQNDEKRYQQIVSILHNRIIDLEN